MATGKKLRSVSETQNRLLLKTCRGSLDTRPPKKAKKSTFTFMGIASMYFSYKYFVLCANVCRCAIYGGGQWTIDEMRCRRE